MNRLVPFAAILLLSLQAYANDEQDLDCKNTRSHFEDKLCLSKEAERLGRRLNQSYRLALNSLDKPSEPGIDYQAARNALKKSQKLWLLFRKEECTVFDQLNLHGTGRSADVANCEIRLTRKRIDDLNRVAKGSP